MNQISSQTQSKVSPGNERVVFDLPSTDQSTVDEKPAFSSGKKMIPKTEFSKAREGVHLVLSAFQKQVRKPSLCLSYMYIQRNCFITGNGSDAIDNKTGR